MLDKMPDLGKYRVNHFVIHDGFSKIVLRKVVMLYLGPAVCHMGIFYNFQKLMIFTNSFFGLFSPNIHLKFSCMSVV